MKLRAGYSSLNLICDSIEEVFTLTRTCTLLDSGYIKDYYIFILINDDLAAIAKATEYNEQNNSSKLIFYHIEPWV